MGRVFRVLVCVAAIGFPSASAYAQAPVSYRLSFPERVHRLMHVDVTFPDLPPGPLQIRMSRSSPGRYALHEFVKNVFDVRITDPTGRALTVSRPNPHQWDVSGHSGSVRLTYRIYGDRVDGTYLAVDTSHAHINMPAALMWARGLELRPATVRFDPPDETWQVSTQLLPEGDRFTYRAPNLHYLMDSPSEFSAHAVHTFTVPDAERRPVFRVAVHHDGTQADVEAFGRDVERVVREQRGIFGDYPVFEGNTYTFLIDTLPSNVKDGMEHRNSTVITSASSVRTGWADLLDTVSHEFFHAWNVERIRPRSLEPFNLDEANMSGELWLAEGFTNYYGPLTLARAGLLSVRGLAQQMGRALDQVITSPGRQVRTAEEMSRQAAFVDAATAIDRTAFDNTFLSYYTWGSVIGLGLDLTLRDRSDGRVTLDHFMRALWEAHGRPGGRLPGFVDRPYTSDDLQAVLATVSGDAAFARDFFSRYIRGHEVPDYRRLLLRAGLVLRLASPAQAFAGEVALEETSGGVRIAEPVPFGSPLYAAGLDRDDLIVSVDGARIATAGDFTRTIHARRPGERVSVAFERRGTRHAAALTLGENPRLILIPSEEVGQPLTANQQQFRDAWLSSTLRNTF